MEMTDSEWILRARHIDPAVPLFYLDGSEPQTPLYIVVAPPSGLRSSEIVWLRDELDAARYGMLPWPDFWERVGGENVLKTSVVLGDLSSAWEESDSPVNEEEAAGIFKAAALKSTLHTLESYAAFAPSTLGRVNAQNIRELPAFVSVNTAFKGITDIAFGYIPEAVSDRDIERVVQGLTISTVFARSHDITGSFLRHPAFAQVKRVTIQSRRFDPGNLQWLNRSTLRHLGVTCSETTVFSDLSSVMPGLWSIDISYSRAAQETGLFGAFPAITFRANGALECDRFAETLKNDSVLSHLEMKFSDLTDEGLEHLSRVRALRYAALIGSRVSAEGVRRVSRERPDCVWTYEVLPSY